MQRLTLKFLFSIFHALSSIFHPLSSICSPRLLGKTAGLATCLILTTACAQAMADQPRYDPLEGSTFFGDSRSARPLEPETVARGRLQEDQLFYTGMIDGEPVDLFPTPITEAVLERGQERYNIFCGPCHGRVGNGRGMIVQRGFRQPPSFHIDRLREAPAGYYFDVMTNGFGAMSSYASRVPPEDRWAITAYIRVLQLSQNATLADVPTDERDNLQQETE